MENSSISVNKIDSIEIISVGTELLMGQVLNTNTNFLAKRLVKIGIPTYYHTVTGDNRDRLKNSIEIAFDRNSGIIFTGGLGPTQDDITLEIVSEVFGKTKEVFSCECEFFPNDKGTAKGIAYSGNYYNAKKNIHEIKTVILLPGPPNELNHMFETYVEPYLEKRAPMKIISTYVKLIGIGESLAESKISDLIKNQKNPTIASYCSTGECMFRVSYTQDLKSKNESPDISLNQIENTTNKIKQILGEYIYEIGNRPLSKVVFDLLDEKNITVSFAESCTGGILTSQLADYSGASKILRGSVVAYSNESKQKLLGVYGDTLKTHGAVSEKTASEMAFGARKIFGSDIAVAVTGIAGPNSDDTKKEVGLVYIAIQTPKTNKVYKFNFKGDRNKIRYLSALNALNIIRRNLLNES